MRCVAIISQLESSLFVDGVTLRSAAKLTWWLSDLHVDMLNLERVKIPPAVNRRDGIKNLRN